MQDDLGPVAERGAHLADAVEAALPGWVERSVRALLEAYAGRADPVVLERAAAAGREAAQAVGEELRTLLATDIDRQWTNPLSLVRAAVRYPGRVLAEAGVPGVVRDRFDEASFPEDDYGLTPFSFADVDPALVEPALEWGAAKASAHLARHGRKATLGEP